MRPIARWSRAGGQKVVEGGGERGLVESLGFPKALSLRPPSPRFSLTSQARARDAPGGRPVKRWGMWRQHAGISQEVRPGADPAPSASRRRPAGARVRRAAARRSSPAPSGAEPPAPSPRRFRGFAPSLDCPRPGIPLHVVEVLATKVVPARDR
jgi:hypothetical protein